jgi:hypothetical protein
VTLPWVNGRIKLDPFANTYGVGLRTPLEPLKRRIINLLMLDEFEKRWKLLVYRIMTMS